DEPTRASPQRPLVLGERASNADAAVHLRRARQRRFRLERGLCSRVPLEYRRTRECGIATARRCSDGSHRRAEIRANGRDGDAECSDGDEQRVRRVGDGLLRSAETGASILSQDLVPASKGSARERAATMKKLNSTNTIGLLIL